MNKKALLKKLQDYAQKCGFKLNPDKKVINRVVNGLLQNLKKHREIYCPCRVITGNRKEDRKIICPCIYHKQEIKETGRCLCGLFVKK